MHGVHHTKGVGQCPRLDLNKSGVQSQITVHSLSLVYANAP